MGGKYISGHIFSPEYLFTEPVGNEPAEAGD